MQRTGSFTRTVSESHLQGSSNVPRSRSESHLQRTSHASINDSNFSQAPPEPVDNRNWKLISFRWAILLGFTACFCCNITDIMYHLKMVTHYWEDPRADFIKFELLVLISSFVIVPLLALGLVIILKQNIYHLRRYLTFLFVSSWEQMLLIVILTQLFPILHIVHTKWENNESIGEYEIQYKCCGLLAPSDYYKSKTGRLPASCFVNPDDVTSKELYNNGCLSQEDPRANFLRIELITTLFQMILVILLVVHYVYLKRIKADVRTFRELFRDRIFL